MCAGVSNAFSSPKALTRGVGQWGAALSLAAKAFGLELAVYMVKVSFHQKPYRRSIMQTFGAQVIASPSMSTKAGRKILTDHPNYQGSLGTAISEAIELAMSTPNCKYTLGSVLNHVLLRGFLSMRRKCLILVFRVLLQKSDRGLLRLGEIWLPDLMDSLACWACLQ